MRTHRPGLLPFAAAALALLCACSGEKGGTPPSPQGAAGIPESFWSESEPAGALPVTQVRAQAAHGDAVVVVGRVGGDEKVFFDNAGVFTLVDPELRACSDEGDPMGDSCRTPWDYCCVDRKKLLESTATVELRQDGRVLAASPRGFHGLDHLATVVVSGTVERDEKGNVVVAAERLHVRR